MFRGPKIAVLIVPLSAMVDPLDLDFQDRKIEVLIHPIPASGWGREYCLDGVAIVPSNDPVSAYAMAFRTGGVEFVSPIGGSTIMWQIENVVFEAWKQFLAFAKSYGVEPPFSVFVSLIEVAGLTFSTGPYSFRTPPPIRQNMVPLPEMLVGPDNFKKPPEVLFKRILHVAANAFRLPRWPSYDADGNYKPR